MKLFKRFFRFLSGHLGTILLLKLLKDDYFLTSLTEISNLVPYLVTMTVYNLDGLIRSLNYSRSRSPYQYFNNFWTLHPSGTFIMKVTGNVYYYYLDYDKGYSCTPVQKYYKHKLLYHYIVKWWLPQTYISLDYLLN